MSELLKLLVSSIKPSPNNPRKHIDAEAQAELVDSIKSKGVIQPILVRIVDDGYELIAGERRWRGSQEAGLDEIPAMVIEATEQEALELSIIENLQRKDITAMEEAEGFQNWLDLTGEPVEALMAKVNKSRSYVYGTVQLLKLAASVAERVRTGEMSRSVALLLSRINDHARQEALAREVVDINLVRSWEKARPMSYREALQHIKEHATQDLKGAIFELSTSYGDLITCDQCPKRSCNDMLILAEHSNDPDVCTDPSCFELKTERSVEPTAAVLRDKGHQVIIGSRIPNGFRRLTETIDVGNFEYKEIKKLLGKRLLPNPGTIWIPTYKAEAGKPIGVINDKDLKRIIKDNGLVKEASDQLKQAMATRVPRGQHWHTQGKFSAMAEQRAALKAIEAFECCADQAALIAGFVLHDDFDPWLSSVSKDAAQRFQLEEGAGWSDLIKSDRSDGAKLLLIASLDEVLELPEEPPMGMYHACDRLNWLCGQLGISTEPTEEDRAAAEQRWPSPPPPETPASAFKKAFAGDKIRTPSKKAKKATAGEKPKASKEEVAAKLKEQLQAADDEPAGQGQDDGPTTPASRAWPWPGNAEDPKHAGQTSDSAFEWDPVTGQRRPRGTVSTEPEAV